MKKKLYSQTIHAFPIIFLLLAFALPVSAKATVLSEVETVGLKITAALPNPDGTDSEGEWIELYNNSGSEIDLIEYEINTNGQYEPILSPGSSKAVLPHKYFYILRNANQAPNFPASSSVVLTKITLKNSVNTILLRKIGETTAQEFLYSKADSGLISRYLQKCTRLETFKQTEYMFYNEYTDFSCEEPEPEPEPEEEEKDEEQPQAPKPTKVTTTNIDNEKAKAAAVYSNINKGMPLPLYRIENPPLGAEKNSIDEQVAKLSGKSYQSPRVVLVSLKSIIGLVCASLALTALLLEVQRFLQAHIAPKLKLYLPKRNQQF